MDAFMPKFTIHNNDSFDGKGDIDEIEDAEDLFSDDEESSISPESMAAIELDALFQDYEEDEDDDE